MWLLTYSTCPVTKVQELFPPRDEGAVSSPSSHRLEVETQGLSSGLSASDALTCFVLHPLWIRPTSLLCSPSTVCWGAASQFRNILYILPVLGVKSTPPHPSSILPSTIAQLLLSSVLISFLFNAGRDWQLGGVLRWWIPAPGSLPFREADSQTCLLITGRAGGGTILFLVAISIFYFEDFLSNGFTQTLFLESCLWDLLVPAEGVSEHCLKERDEV